MNYPCKYCRRKGSKKVFICKSCKIGICNLCVPFPNENIECKVCLEREMKIEQYWKSILSCDENPYENSSKFIYIV